VDTVSKPCSVSIVIRAFNEEKHIEQLLTGILRQDIRDVEIIVVDSGSTDGTGPILTRFPVKVLSINPEEFSFGRSLNIGCAEARGEYIVIASAHAYPVYANWLDKLLAPFSDPRVAISYGKQRGCSTSKFSERQLFQQWFPEVNHVSRTEPFCNNANAAIRRSLWETTPYDESLTGLEDVSWAKAMQQHGYKVAYVSGAEVIHVHEESFSQIYNRYRREAIALKSLSPNETFSFGEFFKLLVTHIGKDLYESLRASSLGDQWSEILAFRFMQLWGTYKGFRQTTPVSARLKKTFYYPRGFRYVPPGSKSAEDPNRIPYSR